MSISAEELRSLMNKDKEVSFDNWIETNLKFLKKEISNAALLKKKCIHFKVPCDYTAEFYKGKLISDYFEEDLFPGCWVVYQTEIDEDTNEHTYYIVVGWVEEEKKNIEKIKYTTWGRGGLGGAGLDTDW